MGTTVLPASIAGRLAGLAAALSLVLTYAPAARAASPSPPVSGAPSPSLHSASPRRTARVGFPGTVPGGLSVGSPTDGHLVGGAHLDESPWLRVVPCYKDSDVRWGLEALVSLIDHGARAVRKQFPDSVLSFGHISRKGGGDIDRHASHESGRDADIGFYISNAQGKPIYAEHFVKFLGDGTAPSWPGAHFDDARNWAFLSAILNDGRAHISHIFVATPLRTRLLEYAQRIGAPYATRVHASEVLAQPRGSLPHDDHFHIRISCPAGMERCIEYPTRNLARFKLLHGRKRGMVATAHAASFSPHEVTLSHRESPVRTPVHAEPGHGAEPSNSDLPAVPAPPPDPTPTPSATGAGAAPPGGSPAGALEAPIDDVDGIEDNVE